MIRVLVVTASPWRDDNNIGNSYSNIFGGVEGLEIANVFCNGGAPNNNIVSRYFKISEQMLVKNIMNKSNPVGEEVVADQEFVPEKTNSVYDKMRLLRFQIFFWARDLIWKIGRWKSQSLMNFIDDFKPDIIFAPLADVMYLNDMLIFIKKYTGKKMVTYAWDDIYTLRQFSVSPLFWINRWLQRIKIKKVASLCEHLYVITALQKKEYEKAFHKECKLLWKGGDFNQKRGNKSLIGKPIKFVFMGNIGAGRWKTLAWLCDALKNINHEKTLACLEIYTLSPKTDKMIKRLNVKGTSMLMNVVAPEEVNKVLDSADILVHVEAFNLKDMLTYRLSFSTKIVDYFINSRCVLAFGGRKTGTMDYLIENDAAIVVTSKDNIEESLKNIIDNPDTIKRYSNNAWECGKKNHQIKDIQEALYSDFQKLV